MYFTRSLSLKLRIAVLVLFLSLACPLAFAARVTVQKSTDGWALQVDGKPFFVKGVGCNVAEGPNKEDYLLMARDMGANATRTWGIKERAYFDKAGEYGLLVDAGVWFDATGESSENHYEDPAYRKKLKMETLDYVRAMKKHPALLMWNLGNEVFAHTDSETEREYFGRFLKDLIDAVHKEDPDHPVVYSSAETLDLPYLKSLVPNLDIIGINSYGPYGVALGWLQTNKVDKPVLATEFGCRGGWDAPKDLNNMPSDPADQFKAGAYIQAWRKIDRSRERSLGGFAFSLGESPNQFSWTWWNINFGAEKRQAYSALATLYTGQDPVNRCPIITQLEIDRVQNVKPGETITVKVDASDMDKDRLSYDFVWTDIEDDPYILRPPRIFYPAIKRLSSKKYRVSVPKESGLFRVYAFVRDGHQNVAIANGSIHVSESASD